MLERHGSPAQGISALQIEIDRRLYLDPALNSPGEGLAAMQELFAVLATRLERAVRKDTGLLAAE
jgi:N-formylglutamate amidohydrolase